MARRQTPDTLCSLLPCACAGTTDSSFPSSEGCHKAAAYFPAKTAATPLAPAGLPTSALEHTGSSGAPSCTVSVALLLSLFQNWMACLNHNKNWILSPIPTNDHFLHSIQTCITHLFLLQKGKKEFNNNWRTPGPKFLTFFFIFTQTGGRRMLLITRPFSYKHLLLQIGFQVNTDPWLEQLPL